MLINNLSRRILGFDPLSRNLRRRLKMKKTQHSFVIFIEKDGESVSSLSLSLSLLYSSQEYHLKTHLSNPLSSFRYGHTWADAAVFVANFFMFGFGLECLFRGYVSGKVPLSQIFSLLYVHTFVVL